MKKRLIPMAAILMGLLSLTGCEGDLGAKMTTAGLNTLMGVGVVFLALIFIIIIIYLMAYLPKIFSGESKAEKPAPVKKEAPVSKPQPAPAPAATVDVTDDLQLVAVITAAIMASLGDAAPADGLVVRSIKKRNTKNWKNA